MKALKLKSSSAENPVFGHVFWISEEKDGAEWMEDIVPSSDKLLPDVFLDSQPDRVYIVNDPMGREANKWEFVAVELKTK